MKMSRFMPTRSQSYKHLCTCRPGVRVTNISVHVDQESEQQTSLHMPTRSQSYKHQYTFQSMAPQISLLQQAAVSSPLSVRFPCYLTFLTIWCGFPWKNRDCNVSAF
ncbi:hypothetical protein AVEN_22548-1 [Araneus ventricosus]|uniref:Uncharacterized protein n=1 Tax=Araneus ventricosus TaxID=182803 RepID=A0A4Y2R0Y1_ARAVE|nr:hypothetical protein AVEN_22548-1 [Araneus ventricosus]